MVQFIKECCAIIDFLVQVSNLLTKLLSQKTINGKSAPSSIRIAKNGVDMGLSIPASFDGADFVSYNMNHFPIGSMFGDDVQISNLPMWPESPYYVGVGI
jgi:hypothetical protein